MVLQLNAYMDNNYLLVLKHILDPWKLVFKHVLEEI